VEAALSVNPGLFLAGNRLFEEFSNHLKNRSDHYW